MSKYTPVKSRIGVSLDEIGLHLGLSRLPEEEDSDYRRRLALQAKVKPGVSETQFIDSVSRSVGLFEEDIFEIDLVLDGNGDPVAPAPRIEVTSAFLRVWSNYPSSDPELEVNIYSRGDGYHLEEVKAKLDALSFITVTVLADTTVPDEDSYKYKRSWHLKCGDSDRLSFNERLPGSYMTRFYNDDLTPRKYIHNCLFSSPLLLSKEKASEDLVVESGDYYVDYTNGILFSYSQAGGLISYEYREFPYKLTRQPVKVIPLYDPDIDFLRKDQLVDDATGEKKNLSLNSYGAEVTNSLLKGYPLQWGE
jgi:hypothetical protein